MGVLDYIMVSKDLLVCSGCHNKGLQAGGLTEQKFSHNCGAKSEIKVLAESIPSQGP